MTALNIVAQPKHGLIHIAGDAAIYTEGGGVVALGTKTFPIAHWPGAVTSNGNANAAVLFASVLSQVASFDLLIDMAPDLLPSLVSMSHLPLGAQVIVAGISEKRGPEAYVFRVNNELPGDVKREDYEASEYWRNEPGELTKLPDYVMAPVSPAEIVIAAGYGGIDVNAEPEDVIWTLRKLLEMQRQTPDDRCAIGGFGYLTTISAECITQRILCRWPDKIGGPLRPDPIDWTQWHIDNPKPVRSATVHHFPSRPTLVKSNRRA